MIARIVNFVLLALRDYRARAEARREADNEAHLRRVTAELSHDYEAQRANVIVMPVRKDSPTVADAERIRARLENRRLKRGAGLN